MMDKLIEEWLSQREAGGNLQRKRGKQVPEVRGYRKELSKKKHLRRHLKLTGQDGECSQVRKGHW